MKAIFTVLALMVALVLTGCGTKAVASSPTPAPSVSLAAAPEKATEAPSENDATTVKHFGEAATYDDGISISVSTPAKFTATELAAGVTPGYKQVVFTLVLTNNTGAPLKPSIFNTVASGGAEAQAIFDSSNPIGSVEGGPRTTVMPGKTVEWLEAYSVKDPKNITFQVSPGYAYKDTIFTNTK